MAYNHLTEDERYTVYEHLRRGAHIRRLPIGSGGAGARGVGRSGGSKASRATDQVKRIALPQSAAEVAEAGPCGGPCAASSSVGSEPALGEG